MRAGGSCLPQVHTVHTKPQVKMSECVHVARKNITQDSVVADIAHIRAPGAQNILEETQRLAKGDVMSCEEADICMSYEEEDAYLAKVTRRNQICSELLVHPKVKFFFVANSHKSEPFTLYISYVHVNI